jgi:hypothetical protein
VQKTIVHFTDDLDQSLQATDTIRFAFNNTEYEIDLADQHITELRSTLDPYVRPPARSAADGGVPLLPGFPPDVGST